MNIDLQNRTFNLAVQIANLIAILPNQTVNRTYFSQLIRSSSSVGANYRSAQRAKSRKDFLNKLKIVEEELDETIYFLELLVAVNKDYSDILEPLIDEATQLLKIIVVSIKTVRSNITEGNH